MRHSDKIATTSQSSARLTLSLAVLCHIAFAQATPQGSEVRISEVSLDNESQVHIKDNRGIETIVPKTTDHEACKDPKVADDRRTVGWLVESANCCTSYPIPLSMVIYRDGRLIQRISPGQSIWDWQFLKAGQQVAFWIGPTHGDFVPHFELHDARSGRLLASWDGHLNGKHPAWVTGLKE